MRPMAGYHGTFHLSRTAHGLGAISVFLTPVIGYVVGVLNCSMFVASYVKK